MSPIEQNRPCQMKIIAHDHKNVRRLTRLFGVSAVPPADAPAAGERRALFTAGVQYTRVSGVNDEQVNGFFHLLEEKGAIDIRDGDWNFCRVVLWGFGTACYANRERIWTAAALVVSTESITGTKKGTHE